MHDIGAIIRNNCPMTSSSWSEVKLETQAEVLDAFTVYFEFDMNDPNIHEYITSACVDRYINWKHDFHQYFQMFPDVESAKEGSKFPEINMFKDVYALPGNEVVVKLHETMVERWDAYIERVASQHPPKTLLEQLTIDDPDAGLHILTKILESLGLRPEKIVRGMGKVKVREVQLQLRSGQSELFHRYSRKWRNYIMS